MGSPRTYFRPDKMVDCAQTDQMYTSANRQCAKKEHARRQRAFDRKAIERGLID
jgi:hypothetical protein